MGCHGCGLFFPNACEYCGAVGDLSQCGGTVLDRLVERQERHQRDVWTQTREGRYSAWRALLERDVAEVERAIVAFAKTADLHEQAIALDERTEAERPTPRTKGAQAAHDLDVLIWAATAHRARVSIADCQAWLTRARAVLR